MNTVPNNTINTNRNNTQLRELLRLAPRNRQTMLFSATFNDDVQQLACECDVCDVLCEMCDVVDVLSGLLSRAVSLLLIFVMWCFSARLLFNFYQHQHACVVFVVLPPVCTAHSLLLQP